MKIKGRQLRSIQVKLEAIHAAIESAQTDNFLKESLFEALEDAKRIVEELEATFQ